MSGYTNEVAEETHDLIHRAEEEEQKAHPGHALTEPDAGEGLAGEAPASSKQKKPQHDKHHSSKIEKVKEALHLK